MKLANWSVHVISWHQAWHYGVFFKCDIPFTSKFVVQECYQLFNIIARSVLRGTVFLIRKLSRFLLFSFGCFSLIFCLSLSKWFDRRPTEWNFVRIECFLFVFWDQLMIGSELYGLVLEDQFGIDSNNTWSFIYIW